MVELRNARLRVQNLPILGMPVFGVRGGDMIHPGVCLVPFGNPTKDHGWLQPKPTVASWRALRLIGITDVRLQFNVGGDSTVREAPVSEHPGEWDTSLFRAFYDPAVKTGVKVNLDYCVGEPVAAHQDAAFHEEAGFRVANEFPEVVDYAVGNEPGADAQKYEGDAGPTATHDYMRDVWFPLYLAFVRGVRRARPDAWFIGCDADSVDIQKRFMDLVEAEDRRAGLTGRASVCNEEAWHPYYHVNPALDYASLKGANGKPGFLDVKTPGRPGGITEIDDSDAGNPFGFLEAIIRGDFGPITRYYELFQGAEYRFFEPEPGGRYSSFHSPNPVVNASGLRYKELFASVNGPVDPPVKALPRRRVVRK